MVDAPRLVTVLGYSPSTTELVAKAIEAACDPPVETIQILLGGIEAVNLMLDPRSSLMVYCPLQGGSSFIVLDTPVQPLRGDCPSTMSEEEWRARKLGSLQTSRMDNEYMGVITLLNRRLAFALVHDGAQYGPCPSTELVAEGLVQFRERLVSNLKYYGLFNSEKADYTPVVVSIGSSCDKLNDVQVQAIQQELDTGGQPLPTALSDQARIWFQQPNWYAPLEYDDIVRSQTCFQAAWSTVSKCGSGF